MEKVIGYSKGKENGIKSDFNQSKAVLSHVSDFLANDLN